MDLGIKGRHALVCGASAGLGRACAEALAAEGVALTIVGRNAERIEAAANEIAARFEVAVTPVAADVTTREGHAQIIESAPEVDILVNNSAGPPPGAFDEHSWDTWVSSVDAMLVAPLMLTRDVITGMRARKFGRIVNVTSAMVKTPAAQMALSAAARTGLTSVMKGLSREVARDNVTINNLLPFLFDTGRQKQMAERAAQRSGKTVAEINVERAGRVAAARFGQASEFGASCAFLCSVHAGYITGQSILLDGGTFPGLI